MNNKTVMTQQRWYLSALQFTQSSDGELLVPASPLTAAALTAATRRHGEGILSEGVHFLVTPDGQGFDFINKNCLMIATRSLSGVKQ